MRSARAVVLGALASGVVGGLVMAPAAAYAGVIGDWQMDEEQGATQMVDSTTPSFHGTIGPDVVLHEATPDGGWGYRFKGDWWIVNDDRLVLWDDDQNGDTSALDPGTEPYAVTIRLKTGARDPNIIQKGQYGQTGGFWKFALKKGWPRCHFQDENGRRKAIGFVNDSRPEAMIADGQWHTLRCERLANGVKMTIDYGEPTEISKWIRGTVGNIDNTRPMTLGGKVDCDYFTVTCDYFAGAVDWVILEKG